jgi:hypothetical protein
MSEAANDNVEWWLAEKGEAHTRVLGWVRYVRNSQAERKVMDLLCESMYGGRAPQSHRRGITAIAQRLPEHGGGGRVQDRGEEQAEADIPHRRCGL